MGQRVARMRADGKLRDIRLAVLPHIAEFVLEPRGVRIQGPRTLGLMWVACAAVVTFCRL
jgi:hypothetical protein